jgi:protein gp37
MSKTTGISWTDSTWNPWRGCTKISEGCQHCYAETLSGRDPGTLGVWGPNGTRVVAAESYWKQPAKWAKAAAGKRHLVFCASLADVFEDWAGPMDSTDGRMLVRPYLDRENVPHNWQMEFKDTFHEDPQGWKPVTMNDVRRRVFAVMESTPELTWLVLTKRPENIRRMVPPAWLENWPANVWPGTTTENQERADERIPHLLKIPAAVRWLSVEPQIGPVDVSPHLVSKRGYFGKVDSLECGGKVYQKRPGIDWVITGGESGHGARPFQVEWARSLRDQCKAAGVAFFHKQHGDHAFDGGELIQLGKAGKLPAEWSPDLRVQEFPEPARA